MLFFVPPAFLFKNHDAASAAAETAVEAAAEAGMSTGEIWAIFGLIAFIVLLFVSLVMVEYSEMLAGIIFAFLVASLLIGILVFEGIVGYGFFYDLKLFDEYWQWGATLLGMLWTLGLFIIVFSTKGKNGLKALLAHFGAFLVVFGFAFALFIGQRYCGRSLEQMRSFGFPVLVLVPILFFYAVSLIDWSSESGGKKKGGREEKLAGPAEVPALTDARASGKSGGGKDCS